ncbi:MAG: NAD(+) synthase [Oscillospiraceae bacterium]|nr:NAD(+) synthase [Oscillospiraceae bacterium]
MKNGWVKAAAATPTVRVADPEYNAGNICTQIGEAAAQGVQVLVFPELCLTGASCGDLFAQRTLLRGAERALEKVIAATAGCSMLVIVGLPAEKDGALYDAAAAVSDGELLGVVPRAQLSPRGETWEGRLFTEGSAVQTQITLCGRTVPFGTDLLFAHRTASELVVGICGSEELWSPDPESTRLAKAGASVICIPAASAELIGRASRRSRTVLETSARLRAGVILACAGEGESTGDLVFTGHRLIAERGECLAQAEQGTGLLVTELDLERLMQDRAALGVFRGYRLPGIPWGGEAAETELTRTVSPSPFIPSDPEELRTRCRTILELQAEGLRKRTEHTWSKRLLVGVSGGLDSTLALLVSAATLKRMGRPSTDLVAVTMPCFGTTARTRSNAEILSERLGADFRVVDIRKSVEQHFLDIGHDITVTDVTFENAQARERTQVLMDLANEYGGMVVGTGDLSELALGWATYNGDHMSMYDVNGGVPKTLMRHVVRTFAEDSEDPALREVLMDILDTPISPELLPPSEGEIAQKTEDLVGPYELHDFFLYYVLRWGFRPQKIFRLAQTAFAGSYSDEVLYKWLENFYRRFFSQQFKRSCLCDGPKVGSVSLSPRGGWVMPSDASRDLWLQELKEIRI